ncbi:MAG: alpha/beta fold hydrolase [Gammaproteobacteria bacterium]|nr:alpha/beta fold hydrolase [Gammaproteobacteria bacterium]
MESQSIIVHGANMHYLSSGRGKTVLFLHGAPGSSAIWEPIISRLSSFAQCIAVDLIGMGRSDKPRIDYSIEDHNLFLSGFIEALNLRYFSLVVTGWGSVVGLDYARRNPDNIARLVFVESFLRIEKNRQDLSLVFEKLKIMAQSDPIKLRRMLTTAFWRTVEDNPYVNPNSPVSAVIDAYSAWLEKTPIKKLLFYGGSGFLTTRATVMWATKALPNLKTVDLGIDAVSLTDAMADKFAEEMQGWL